MDKNKAKLFGYYTGIGFGIVLVVAFLISQIIMPIFFGRPKSIEVPDVTNLLSSKAMNLLMDKKIHVVIKDSLYSDSVDRGGVVSQKPEPGEMVKPDGTVYLILSMGSKFVKVPELIGLNVQSAWIVLKNSGLRLIVADSVYSDLYPVNTIVQSTPGYGDRVEKKSKVKLYISKGNTVTPDSTGIEDEFNY
jgi:eukaryotic-like serine/threonine-protein kinase